MYYKYISVALISLINKSGRVLLDVIAIGLHHLLDASYWWLRRDHPGPRMDRVQRRVAKASGWFVLVVCLKKGGGGLLTFFAWDAVSVGFFQGCVFDVPPPCWFLVMCFLFVAPCSCFLGVWIFWDNGQMI